MCFSRFWQADSRSQRYADRYLVKEPKPVDAKLWQIAEGDRIGVRDRIVSKVEICSLGFHTDCWKWLGQNDGGRGYGRIWVYGRRQLAHRVSFMAFKGPVPIGLAVDHLCGNPCCCNPDHLEAVTGQENVRRGRLSESSKIRAELRTHCRRGHEFVASNIIIRKTDGARQCRACARLAWDKYRAKRANGYRPRSFPQSDTAQVRTHPDCDGHPADTVSSVCGDAVRTFEARKDGQGGAFHEDTDR